MFLLAWYEKWLEIRYTARQRENVVVKEEHVCDSCETLKSLLEAERYEKSQLIARLLEKPVAEPERTQAPQMVTRPVVVPWRVRQQMLEKEDRAKARAAAGAAKPDTNNTTAPIEDLEQELNIAEQTRSTEAGKQNS